MLQQGTKLAVLGWDFAGCITSYGDDRLGDFTICASNPGMTNFVKVGTILWGQDCALPPYPGVYASISFTIQSIDETVCSFNMDYCGKIAAPNLLGHLYPPGKLLKSDADANDTPLENCVDTAGEFVVKDEQKCERFIKSCNWLAEPDSTDTNDLQDFQRMMQSQCTVNFKYAGFGSDKAPCGSNKELCVLFLSCEWQWQCCCYKINCWCHPRM
eukprot:5564788-Ditylum_brightwellii.AAC.1